MMMLGAAGCSSSVASVVRFPSMGIIIVLGILAQMPQPTAPYKIATLDPGDDCNQTIYLEDGAKSSAILRLTANEFYDHSEPKLCTVTFKAPQHSWSGLTGVLEEVDLRRYNDTANHHLAESYCVDYIKVTVAGTVTGPTHVHSSPGAYEQCGTWSVKPEQRLNRNGIYHKELFGYYESQTSQVREMRVEVSIGKKDGIHQVPYKKEWGRHRGFTFVVTAFRYSFGESTCVPGLRSCGSPDWHAGQQHCVHESLWCDRHINCGQTENRDENSCHKEGREMWGGLVTVMAGPWVGAALLLMLVLGGFLCWRRTRGLPGPPGPEPQPQPQDINSYAESYEVSSTLSSAHHMAIQVRVVCNSNHACHNGRTGGPLFVDHPPSYDTLFPQGPPESYQSTQPNTPVSIASSNSTLFTTTTSAGASSSSATSLPRGARRPHRNNRANNTLTPNLGGARPKRSNSRNHNVTTVSCQSNGSSAPSFPIQRQTSSASNSSATLAEHTATSNTSTTGYHSVSLRDTASVSYSSLPSGQNNLDHQSQTNKDGSRFTTFPRACRKMPTSNNDHPGKGLRNESNQRNANNQSNMQGNNSREVISILNDRQVLYESRRGEYFSNRQVLYESRRSEDSADSINGLDPEDESTSQSGAASKSGSQAVLVDESPSLSSIHSIQDTSHLDYSVHPHENRTEISREVDTLDSMADISEIHDSRGDYSEMSDYNSDHSRIHSLDLPGPSDCRANKSRSLKRDKVSSPITDEDKSMQNEITDET